MSKKEIERLTAAEYNAKYGSRFKDYSSNKKGKYGAIKSEVGDKKFDSQSEGKLFWELKMQERQGLIREVIMQAKEELRAYGKVICDYYVDFKVIHNDGKIEFIEHKSEGTITPAWRIKWKMLEAKYADDKNVECRINWYKGFKTIKR